MRPSRQAPEQGKEWKTALSALLEKRGKKSVAPPPPPSPILIDDSSESGSEDYQDCYTSEYEQHSTHSRDNTQRNDIDIESLMTGLSSMGLNSSRSGGEQHQREAAKDDSEKDSDDEDDVSVTVPKQSTQESTDLVAGPANEFRLRGAISGKLYPHQVEGVKWLYKLYKEEKGGILGDDMGLGKTMQCAAFIAGLIQCNLAKSIMIVAPKTLLAHWEKELQVCQVGRHIIDFCGGSEGARAEALRHVARKTSIMLTTYGMIQHNYHRLKSPGDSRYSDEPFKWDLMILDEGHKIKNPKMQLYQRLQEIPVKVCVIISGTPIQNNLAELWALYNYCTPDLLGTKSWFKTQFENIITAGQDKDATAYQRQRGAAKAAELRQLIEPYLLRREKKTVLNGPVGSDANTGEESKDGSTQPKPQGMPHKNDFIVWLRPSPLQQSVYRAYLQSSAVKEALCTSGHPLAAITILKKICDHPALLSQRAAGMVMRGAKKWAGAGGQDDEESDDEESDAGSEDSMGDFIVVDDDDDDDESDEEEWERKRVEKKKQKEAMKNRRKEVSVLDEEFEQLDSGVEGKILEHLEKAHEKGADASCKTLFVLTLLDQLVQEKHRTLVFSQSRVMLDIIQSGIREKGMKFCRVDGSMAKASDRQREVNKFQTDASIPVFLLTSQVGGLGLTITAADRVVIVDPAWNPATDNQSVDRAYRIGQTRDVVVYRLITCGTVEEKIYRRQVFKAGLFRTGVEEGVQFRYFSAQEIRDLFAWKPEEIERSVTQQQLHELHAHQRKLGAEVLQHLQFLESLDNFAGVSDHDLLFSKKSEDERSDELRPEDLATAPKPPAEPFERPSAGQNLGLDAITSQMKGMNIRPSKPAAATAAGDLELSKIRRQLEVAQEEVKKYEAYLQQPTFKMSEEGKDKLMRKLEKCTESVAMLMGKERKLLRSRAEGEKLKNITNVGGALSHPTSSETSSYATDGTSSFASTPSGMPSAQHKGGSHLKGSASSSMSTPPSVGSGQHKASSSSTYMSRPGVPYA